MFNFLNIFLDIRFANLYNIFNKTQEVNILTLSELIISYRKEYGLSQRKFAELSGLSNGYISMLEKGENPNTNLPITPTLPQLKKLAQAMNLSLSELFTKIDDIDISLNTESLEQGKALPDNIIPVPKMRKIPLLGTIACGEPILAAENIEGEISIPDDINADFALRCKGDSMIEARILDGDIVYIKQQPTVNNGQIAAVLIGDEATLKRVYLSDNTITLVACNTSFAPLVYSGQELETVRILGRAVAYTSFIR